MVKGSIIPPWSAIFTAIIFATSITDSFSVPVTSTKRFSSPTFTFPRLLLLITGGNDITSPESSVKRGNLSNFATILPYWIPFGCFSRISESVISSSNPRGIKDFVFSEAT